MKRILKVIISVVVVVIVFFSLKEFGAFDRFVKIDNGGGAVTEDKIGMPSNVDSGEGTDADKSDENPDQASVSYKFGKCFLPVVYYIGEVDSKFGISRESVIASAKQAEAIWEKKSEKNIFEYSDNGIGLPINLIYDERQAETDYLKKQFSDLSDKKTKYDYLRTEYDSLVSNMNSSRDNFESLKNTYESFLSKFNIEKDNFETDKRKYDIQIADWNARGVISESEYKILQDEGTRLRAVAADLNADYEDLKSIYDQLTKAKESFNMVVGKVNAVANLVNQTAESLNQRVTEYNHVSEGRDEFVTGYYKQSSEGRQIDIFQFDSREELSIIMAHELGHSLGIGHATSVNSVMYARTTKGTGVASDEDIEMLKTACSAFTE